MNREERIKFAIDKGITCDPNTGKIYGIFGKEITNKMKLGYIQIQVYDKEKRYMIYGHHFVWYWVHKEIVKLLDHKNEIRNDNSIDNLRPFTYQLNLMNRKNIKGYTKTKYGYLTKIIKDDKPIYLGVYKTAEEANKVYLTARRMLFKDFQE